jgi:hypothetical protein
LTLSRVVADLDPIKGQPLAHKPVDFLDCILGQRSPADIGLVSSNNEQKCGRLKTVTSGFYTR